MKIVDKRLLFINSQDRVSGSIENFTVELPSHLLMRQKNQRTRLILNDLVLPYTWYNVQATNNNFVVVETILGVSTPVIITIPVGSYHALQLRTQIQTLLNASLQDTYTVAYQEVSGKFKFVIGTNVNRTAQPQFIMSVDTSNHTNRLIGFTPATTHVFVNNELQSSGSINMMFTDALFMHIDLPNNNVTKGSGNKDTFHVSNSFAKIPINSSPFNNIIYNNTNDDFLLNTADVVIDTLRFSIKTLNHEPIVLNDDYSFTLKLEVIEDDEKQLILQNSGLGELLKMLILQNQKLLELISRI
jgi:hypothetical protein